MPNTNQSNRNSKKNAPTKLVALIRLHEAKRLTGLSTSAIYRLIAEDRFPRQVSLGTPRSMAFVESEVAAWIQERIDDRDSGGNESR
jgi:prophage regulatory protein